FARHHLVTVAGHDVGHDDALECLVNLRSALVRLELLLTRPRQRFGLQAERARHRSSALTPYLCVPTLSAPSQCRQGSTSLCQNCASKAFFVFLRSLRDFTKPLSGLVEPSGRSGRI